MRHYILIATSVLLAHISFAQSVMSYNINKGGFHSSPSYFTPFKGRLYFTAFDSLHGIELRSIDTGESPILVADVAKGTADGTIGICTRGGANNCVNSNGTPCKQMAVAKDVDGNELALYFYGSDRPLAPGLRRYTLYKYDGVNPPVAVITNFDNDRIAGDWELTAITDKVYFRVSVQSTALSELYEYDHTSNIYKKLFTGPYNAGVINLTPYKSKLVFNRKDQVYEYDPGTQQIYQVAVNLAFKVATDIKVIDDILYYAEQGGGLYAYDGVSVNKIANAVCETDASSARPTNDDPYYSNGNGFGRQIGGYKGKVYFPCNISPKCMLCEYDPATKVTRQIPGVSTPNNFAVAKNKLFFIGNDADHGFELWSYDGFSASRTLDIYPGKRSGAFHGMTSFKNEIYLSGMVMDTIGVELLKYVPRTSGSTNGIRNSAVKGKVEIHPNPAENSCTINLDLYEAQELKIQIYNNMGQDVESIDRQQYLPGSNNIDLDISQLSTGVYMIMISDNNAQMVYSTRLVKQ